MNCGVDQGAERSVQPSLRPLLLAVTLTCLAIGLGLGSGEHRLVFALGGGMVAIGFVLSVCQGRAVAADAATIGAVWIGSFIIVPLLLSVRSRLHLVGVHSPGEAAWGLAIWVASIGVFVGFPALAGVFRTRLSVFAMLVAESLFFATIIAVATGGPDIPRLVLIQWTGSVLVFVGGNCTSSSLRRRSWLPLFGAMLLLAFGFVLVVVMTWVPLYLE